MTDLSGYAKKSSANGDTRSGLWLRLRIAVPGRAADADPPQHLTCGKFNSRSLVADAIRRHHRAYSDAAFSRAGPAPQLGQRCPIGDCGHYLGGLHRAVHEAGDGGRRPGMRTAWPPVRSLTSVGLTAAACARMRTSPGPACGSGRSSTPSPLSRPAKQDRQLVVEPLAVAWPPRVVMEAAPG